MEVVTGKRGAIWLYRALAFFFFFDLLLITNTKSEYLIDKRQGGGASGRMKGLNYGFRQDDLRPLTWNIMTLLWAGFLGGGGFYLDACTTFFSLSFSLVYKYVKTRCVFIKSWAT